MLESVEDLLHSVKRGLFGLSFGLMSFGSRRLLHWWGTIPAVGLSAILSQWDKVREDELLLRYYGDEIAAKTGKKKSAIAIGDLRDAAGDNPAIEEQLYRNNLKRNLSIATAAIAIVGTYALLTVALPAAPVIGAFLTTATQAGGFQAAAAFVAKAFIGLGAFNLLEEGVQHVAEKVIGRIGGHVMDLKVPTLHSQVQQIDRQLRQGIKISPEQVMAAHILGNPRLQEEVSAQFGRGALALFEKPESELGKDDRLHKKNIVARMGKDYAIEWKTEMLNSKRMRPQELAFCVHGQCSGVPTLEAPPVSWSDRSREKLNHATAKTKDLLQRGIDLGKQKLGFRNAQVQQGAQIASPEQEQQSTFFQDMIRGGKDVPVLGTSR